MSLSDDWRERHGHKQSDSRVFIYIILLLAIIFFIARAGSFSQRFTETFMGTQDSTDVESVELETNE